MSMGGGGVNDAQAVIQYTDPQAAYMAGNLGATSALAAQQFASQQINNAINQLNQSYRSAVTGMQPYTQTGVQALDQLNQYLGLNPYTPAVAPTAPISPSGTINWGNGSLDGNTDWSKLNSMATSIANSGRVGKVTLAPNDQAHNITSVATMLSGTNKALSPTEFQFLNAYMQAGGTPGQPGGDFLMHFNDQAQAQYKSQLQDYNLAQANYNQDQSWAQQYGTPLTASQITQNVTNQPGYQAELSQGIDAITKSAAAKGYIGSGAILKNLGIYGQQTLSKYYGDTLSRLAGMVSAGQNSANTVSGLYANQGNNVASLYSNLGDVGANAQLTAGNALMNAMITANQKYKTMDIGGGSSGGGGLGGIGQAIGSVASLAQAFSSKDLKEDFTPINKEEILNKVNSLDIERWKYKEIPVDHMGAYAGQFKEIFGVGDGMTINLVDCIGILMASVQALSNKVENLQKELTNGSN